MTEALTILVVDDSPTMRAVLGVILGAGGHEVVFAENVDVGLEAVWLRRPDVVLTDYTMPDRTGCDLVKSLRADGYDGPVFVVSGERSPDIQAAVSRAGADGWLPKPVCAATLLEAIDLAWRNESVSRPSTGQLEPMRSSRLG